MVTAEKYGLKGVVIGATYPSGGMKSCRLAQYNEIRVRNQVFVPRYKKPDERKKDNKALAFYENGCIKSIALEERTEVMTSLGVFRAELVTFYENGEIDSLFPLNGQIGFGWSEEDEEKLLEENHFTFPFTRFTEKVIGLRFYPGGKLKSLILWPGKRISIETALGEFPARIGFRLYENGTLESFEPAVPIEINSRIGTIVAFDQNALGIDADYNSVNFYPDGSLKSVKTNSDIVVNGISTGERTIIYQQLKFDNMTGKMMKVPVLITFADNEAVIDNAVEKKTFFIDDSKFMLLHDQYYTEKKCSPGSDCSGCGASCL
ncbi:hypothetical protein AALB39_00055 [Lachnospiraceae bacterium 54-53]